VPARQSSQALSQWYLRPYFQFVYLLTIFPNSVRGPDAVGEEQDLRMAETSSKSPTIFATPSMSATAFVPSNHPLCREDQTLSSLPFIPLHPRHCAPLRSQPNGNLIRHSTRHNPTECYYGRRHFVDTADEDPLIEALKRQVQASEGGRKMRSVQRLGNSCWDKRVGWGGRERAGVGGGWRPDDNNTNDSRNTAADQHPPSHPITMRPS
jgi:hypothetical protein